MSLLAGLLIALATLSPQQAARISEAEEQGRLLKRIDDAGWGSTDALLTSFPDPAAAGIRGWIVDPRPETTLAIYFGEAGEGHVPIFTAEMKDRSVVRSVRSGGAATDRIEPGLDRMIVAREAALAWISEKADALFCASAPANTVVLPPRGSHGTISVFILTPQVDANLPLGGHHRVDVDATGRIVGHRTYSKACMTIAPPTPDVAALYVTHMLDDEPTPIHVFQSLNLSKPLAVATRTGTWLVDAGRISLIKD